MLINGSAINAVVLNGSATAATTDATGLPSGVQVTASVGTAVGVGIANVTVTPSGVYVTAAIGTATASGAATGIVTGLQVTASVGDATAVVIVLPAWGLPDGVKVTASVGTATASANRSATATPDGVQVTIYLGVAKSRVLVTQYAYVRGESRRMVIPLCPRTSLVGAEPRKTIIVEDDRRLVA